MSAPPIGTIKRTPSSSEIATISQKARLGWSVANQTMSATSRMPSARFTKCCPKKTSGLPVIRPCSLPKAITEPEKVMAPMAVPRLISMRLPAGMAPRVPSP